MSARHAPGRGTLAAIAHLTIVAVIGNWAFGQAPNENPSENLGSSLEPTPLQPCRMDQDGYLRGEIFGSLTQVLDWRGAGMICDGMLRPNDDGFRLVFSESAAKPDQGLRLVIGIAGTQLGLANEEHVANVTLIDQDEGRFFSTQGLERCWVRLTDQIRLPKLAESWRVDGRLYCLGALAAVEGADSITLGEIEFSGRVLIEAENPTEREPRNAI